MWQRSNTPKTTAHSCGGPVFGRKTPGCPRCDELLAGAAPVVWGNGWQDATARRLGFRNDDARRTYEIRHHDCAVRGCGSVCTFGEW